MGIQILSIVVTIAKISFVVFGIVAIVQRIRHWQWRKAHPDMPAVPADQKTLHKAFLSSLASVMLCAIVFGFSILFPLAYREISGSDHILAGVRYAVGFAVLWLIAIAFICWIFALFAIIDLLHQRSVLRKSPLAIASYILEGIVVIYFLLIFVRIVIDSISF